MKNKITLLTLALCAGMLFNVQLYAQYSQQERTDAAQAKQDHVDSLEVAYKQEQKQLQNDEDDRSRMADAKLERKQTKAKAKEAKRVEREANDALRQSRNAVRAEKKAQKSRKDADKQAERASQARDKSDDNK